MIYQHQLHLTIQTVPTFINVDYGIMLKLKI